MVGDERDHRGRDLDEVSPAVRKELWARSRTSAPLQQVKRNEGKTVVVLACLKRGASSERQAPRAAETRGPCFGFMEVAAMEELTRSFNTCYDGSSIKFLEQMKRMMCHPDDDMAIERSR